MAAPALRELPAGVPPAPPRSMACEPPRHGACELDKENAASGVQSDEEWEPSQAAAQSQASESQACAPSRRRIRSKAETPATAVDSDAAPPLPDSPADSPAPAAPAAPPSPPPVAAAPPSPLPLTPSRADWARGVAAAASASLMSGLSALRRLSLSPLPQRPAPPPLLPDAPVVVAEPPVAPAQPAPPARPVAAAAEAAEAAPPRRRRIRSKRSLDTAAAAALPPPPSPDALADALADVALAAPAPVPAEPKAAPALPPLPRATASSSEGDESESDSDGDDSATASPPRCRAAAAANTEKRAPLLAVSDDEADAAQRLEFADAASNARFVLSARLSARLFPHQREGVTWLWRRHVAGQGGLLGDDMGLGKTFQVASFLAGLLRGGAITRALVVAPSTLQAQWLSELERCGLGGCTHVYGDGSRARAAALSAVRSRGGVLVTTYGMVQHNPVALGGSKPKGDAAACGSDDERAAEDGDDGSDSGGDDGDETRLRWDWMICDEGHKLKNPRMQLVARLTSLRATRRLLLTGTPVQNNLSELWALFNFVTPGLLGDSREFREEFDKPIARGQSREASGRERDAGAATAAALKRRIAPAFLRREKKGVLTAAPAAAADASAAPSAPKPGALGSKTDIIVWLRLTPPQRRLYAAFLGSSSVAAALNKTGSALAAITVLKKICDHPGLLSSNAAAEIARGRPLASVLAGSTAGSAAAGDDADVAEDGDAGGAPAGACDPAASCKSAFVLAFVASVAAAGHRVLVFSQSRAMLDGIEAAARAAGWRLCRIDGNVPASERARRVAAFQADATIPLFLLTSAVGGLGLTLTGADRVVVIDPSWNPAADAQAVDRAYRLGQTRDVAVYRLITCGTVEEKIYRKQVFKAGLSRAGTGGADVARYFTSGELRDLFACEPAALEASATAAALAQRHGAAGACAPADVADELRRVVAAHPAVAAVTDHDALFSAPDDTAPGPGVGGDPPASRTPGTPARGGGGGGGGAKAPMQGGGGGGGSWRGGPSHGMWSGGANGGGVLAAALARVPNAKGAASAAPSADALAAVKAQQKAARIREITAQMERFSALLSKPNFPLPDGGANIRAKRDALAAELEKLRPSDKKEEEEEEEEEHTPQALPEAAQSQPLEAAASSTVAEDKLLASLGSLTM